VLDNNNQALLLNDIFTITKLLLMIYLIS